MNSSPSTLAVLFAFAVLAALAGGAYFFFQDIYQFLRTLDRQVAATIVAVLVAALYIGLSIRRAGQINGVGHFRLSKQAESYTRFLNAYFSTAAEQGGDSQYMAASPEVETAKRDLLLWASTGVLKQLAAYQRMNSQMIPRDPAARSSLENLLRTMRSDLGKNNIGLGEDDLISLLTPEGPTPSKVTVEDA